MRSRPVVTCSLVAIVFAACGSDSGSTKGTTDSSASDVSSASDTDATSVSDAADTTTETRPDTTPDTQPDSVGDSTAPCQPITVAVTDPALQLKDTNKFWTTNLSPQLGGDAADRLQLDFWQPTTGPVGLGSGGNRSSDTCSQCVRLYQDWDGEGNPGKQFFQTGGTLDIDPSSSPQAGALTVTLTDVTLVEVTISGGGAGASIPVPGGDCLVIQSPTTLSTSCLPDCDQKACGDDGCGGSCGDCLANEECTASGQCQCVPDCVDRTCGDDGCGGSCGDCLANEECTASGQCQCVPDCVDRTCGGDGCGGSCGECRSNEACTDAGQCECVPDCNDKVCGDDGCGGSCGGCGDNAVCKVDQSGCQLTGCTEVTIGESLLAWQSQLHYAAFDTIDFTPALGDPDTFDLLRLEMWTNETGTFDLASDINANYDSCSQCVRLFEDLSDEGVPGRQYFQWSGQIDINADTPPQSGLLTATLSDVTLVEATIDTHSSGIGVVSTVVPGGACITLSSPATVTTGGPCTPSCQGKVCGPDTCGGSCGDGCLDNETCSADGTRCICNPACGGKVCGPDGCGGTCGGGCLSNEACNAEGSACICQPDCEGKVCGSDGCGGSCGAGCQGLETCSADGTLCVPPPCTEVDVSGELVKVGAARFRTEGMSALGSGLPERFELEFYTNETGDFDLGTGDNGAYESCAQCVLVKQDVDTGGTSARTFFQSGGSITIAALTPPYAGDDLSVTLTDLTMSEVTLSGGASAPVPGGACLKFETPLSVSTAICAPSCQGKTCLDDDGCGGSCGPCTVSFASDVAPLLQNTTSAGGLGCTNCHSGSAPAYGLDLGGTPANLYSTLTGSALLNKSTPAESELLTKITFPASHQGTSLTLGSDDYETLLDWITEGCVNTP